MREVLQQMPAGSKWEVDAAAGQGLRRRSAHRFPPNVAVQFEVKLVSVK